MSEYDYAAVMVECHTGDLVDYPPRYSKLNAKSLVRTLMAWDQRFRVSWWFAGNRGRAEGMTFRMLERFWLDRHSGHGPKPAC
jgi:hypothetical protein